jgi:hypothetical protein
MRWITKLGILIVNVRASLVFQIGTGTKEISRRPFKEGDLAQKRVSASNTQLHVEVCNLKELQREYDRKKPPINFS